MGSIETVFYFWKSRRFGTKKMMMIYLMCGLIGNLISVAIDPFKLAVVASATHTPSTVCFFPRPGEVLHFAWSIANLGVTVVCLMSPVLGSSVPCGFR
jgi:hypothetical protein